jgi:hypothetical protein
MYSDAMSSRPSSPPTISPKRRRAAAASSAMSASSNPTMATTRSCDIDPHCIARVVLERVLQVEVGARPTHQRLLGLSSSTLGVVCGQPLHRAQAHFQYGFEIRNAAGRCFGRPQGDPLEQLNQSTTIQEPPKRERGGHVLVPPNPGALLAKHGVRLITKVDRAQPMPQTEFKCASYTVLVPTSSEWIIDETPGPADSCDRVSHGTGRRRSRRRTGANASVNEPFVVTAALPAGGRPTITTRLYKSKLMPCTAPQHFGSKLAFK